MTSKEREVSQNLVQSIVTSKLRQVQCFQKGCFLGFVNRCSVSEGRCLGFVDRCSVFKGRFLGFVDRCTVFKGRFLGFVDRCSVFEGRVLGFVDRGSVFVCSAEPVQPMVTPKAQQQ